MRELDDLEKKIILELIRDARASDNFVSRKAKIPVATVNRKRKQLEKEGIINYLTYVNNWKAGTEVFSSRQLFIIKLRYGITRRQFLEALLKPETVTPLLVKHVMNLHIGEIGGQLALVMLLESRLETDMLEIFNAEVIPTLQSALGKDAIQDTVAVPIAQSMVLLHNYNELNTENGRIKPSWPNDKIFIQ